MTKQDVIRIHWTALFFMYGWLMYENTTGVLLCILFDTMLLAMYRHVYGGKIGKENMLLEILVHFFLLLLVVGFTRPLALLCGMVSSVSAHVVDERKSLPMIVCTTVITTGISIYLHDLYAFVMLMSLFVPHTYRLLYTYFFLQNSTFKVLRETVK